MSDYKILKRIKESYTTPEGKNSNQYFYLIQDKYGVCKIRCNSWDKKQITTVASSIDKNFYIINMFKEVHGNLFDYSLVDYKSSREKIKIICPIHGVFEQTPNAHLRKSGCKKCYNEFKRSQSIKLTNEEFVQKSIDIHGNNKYKILSPYFDSRSKITFKCSKGHIYKQKASIHLAGHGCPCCYGLYKNHNDFVKEANKIHHDEYEFLSEYKKSWEKIKIKHKICGHVFTRFPSNHLQGVGCPNCRKLTCGHTKTHFINSCIKNNKGLGIFYIIKCFNENETFYKFGITSNSVVSRYRSSTSMPYTYEIIQEVTDVAENIFDFEKFIKSYIYKNKLNYKPKLSFGGQTECILNLLGSSMTTSTKS